MSTDPAAAILVIDDEPGIRKFALRVLQDAGYQVMEAGDGRQGLGIFAAQVQEFAAVLMDLSMPGMEGRELVRELRRLAPDIPILVMSGYSDMEAAEKLEGTGVNAFVHKPFRPAELVERLGLTLAPKQVAGPEK